MKNQRYITVTKVFLTLVAFGRLPSWYEKCFLTLELNNGLPLVMIIIVETKAYAILYFS